MALFYECMLQCARKVLDAADIVREGDFTPVIQAQGFESWIFTSAGLAKSFGSNSIRAYCE